MNEIEERIRNSLKKIELDDCKTLKDVIKDLIERHKTKGLSLAKVLRISQVPENIFRRMKSEKGYGGPNLESCIKMGLAIGCTDIKEFDEILSARGFANLSDGPNILHKKYKCIVSIILSEKEMPLEDRVNLFITSADLVN